MNISENYVSLKSFHENFNTLTVTEKNSQKIFKMLSELKIHLTNALFFMNSKNLINKLDLLKIKWYEHTFFSTYLIDFIIN